MDSGATVHGIAESGTTERLILSMFFLLCLGSLDLTSFNLLTFQPPVSAPPFGPGFTQQPY